MEAVKHPFSEAEVARLRRFDRRLMIEPEPGYKGEYRLVYFDANGVKEAAMRGVTSLGMGTMTKLVEKAPWRMNQSLHSWAKRSIDDENDSDLALDQSRFKEKMAEAKLKTKSHLRKAGVI